MEVPPSESFRSWARAPLILRLPDSKIQRKFTLPDLAGITQLVETETMNRPWLYTEAGKAR